MYIWTDHKRHSIISKYKITFDRLTDLKNRSLTIRCSLVSDMGHPFEARKTNSDFSSFIRNCSLLSQQKRSAMLFFRGEA